MAYELTVALVVRDQAKYAQYRKEIAPLLEQAGAGFRYDFDVARTLKGEESGEYNRVFVIRFPSQAVKEAFFADPRYIEIRSRQFVPSVDKMTVVAEYAAVK